MKTILHSIAVTVSTFSWLFCRELYIMVSSQDKDKIASIISIYEDQRQKIGWNTVGNIHDF